MGCEYSDCKREAEHYSDDMMLCDKHKRLADYCYYFQGGAMLGGIAGFLGL